MRGLRADIVDRSMIPDALDIAAGGRLSHEISSHRTANRHDVGAARRTILRFLENVPEDMTVQELREALDT